MYKSQRAICENVKSCHLYVYFNLCESTSVSIWVWGKNYFSKIPCKSLNTSNYFINNNKFWLLIFRNPFFILSFILSLLYFPPHISISLYILCSRLGRGMEGILQDTSFKAFGFFKWDFSFRHSLDSF